MKPVNTNSSPSELRITDMRFVDIDGAPKRCTLIKIMTNQGLTGYGEVRDASSKLYAQMLKSRILGENPCNVDKIFHKIKQFGGHSRQGGGVSGVEIALWDLAGKAYGVPLYQLLGGKFRDEVRVYCDTDVDGRHTGRDMGLALKKRMDMGFTFLKMDLGIGLLMDEPGTINAPLGFIDDMKKYAPHVLNVQGGSVTADMVKHQKSYAIVNTPHLFTGIHLTEKGLDYLENYVKEVREVIGYEVPVAIDHFGHVCVEDCIRFARRMERYNIAWMEDRYLDALYQMTLEEVWKPIFVLGYENQFEGRLRVLHDDGRKLVGRAVTATYMPTRPDLHETMFEVGKSEGRKGNYNQWVIDSLRERDVVVADMYDKIFRIRVRYIFRQTEYRGPAGLLKGVGLSGRGGGVEDLLSHHPAAVQAGDGHTIHFTGHRQLERLSVAISGHPFLLQAGDLSWSSPVQRTGERDLLWTQDGSVGN